MTLRLLLAAVLYALTVLAGAGLMFTASTLLARAAFHPPLYTLMLLVTGVRFFGISRGVFRYLERLTSHDATFRYLAALRARIFEALIPRIPGGLDAGRGALQERILGDVARLEPVPVKILVPLLGSGIVLILLSPFLGHYHPALTAWVAGGFALAGLLLPAAVYLGLKTRQEGRRLAAEALRQRASELAEGLPELLAYGAVPRFQEAIAAEAKEAARRERHEAWILALGEAGAELIAGMVLAGLFATGVKATRAGLSAELLPGLVLAGFAAFEAVRPLASSGLLLAEARAAWARIRALLLAPLPAPEPEKPRNLPPGFDLTLRDAWVRYPGAEKPALEGASLELPEGKALLLFGKSGSGKSTIAWTWLRFLLPEAGEAQHGGVPIPELSGEDARRRIVYLEPEPHVFPTTPRENLMLANPEASEEALWRALEAAQLADRIHSLPKGLDTPLGPGGVELSGGEARRLSIARAILKNAAIWFLDEPTEGLDRETEARLLETLAPLLQGKSALWISHRPLPGLDLPRYQVESGRLRRV